MTTTVDSNQGYHGRHGNFSHLQISGSIVGPTTAHEGITTATSTTNVYNVSNADSGKVFAMTLPATTDITVNLPDPSPGVEFTFLITSIAGAGADIVLTAQGTQLNGCVCAAAAVVAAADSTTLTFDQDQGSAVGDHVFVKGISTTEWFVTGNVALAAALDAT